MAGALAALNRDDADGISLVERDPLAYALMRLLHHRRAAEVAELNQISTQLGAAAGTNPLPAIARWWVWRNDHCLFTTRRHHSALRSTGFGLGHARGLWHSSKLGPPEITA